MNSGKKTAGKFASARKAAINVVPDIGFTDRIYAGVMDKMAAKERRAARPEPAFFVLASVFCTLLAVLLLTEVQIAREKAVYIIDLLFFGIPFVNI